MATKKPYTEAVPTYEDSYGDEYARENQRPEAPVATMTVALVEYKHVPIMAGTKSIGQMVDEYLDRCRNADMRIVQGLTIQFPVNAFEGF